MLRPPLPLREFAELELLIRSQYPLVVLNTAEEERADVLLEYLADSVGLPYFTWSNLAGLTRKGQEHPVYGTEKLAAALDHIRASGLPAIYHIKDSAEHFQNATFCRKLRELHQRFYEHPGTIVLTGTDIEFSEALRPLLANVVLSPPSDDEYFEFAQSLLKEVRTRMPVSMKLDATQVRQLISHLRGLTLMEVRKVLTQAMVVDGELGPQDLERVLLAKREIVERTGVLEYFCQNEGLDAVAGLANLKQWLTSRATVFRDPERAREFGLEAPRGLLLVGVQGCGKSLCAKAVSKAWQVPLIRLDPARLYNKFIGETEKNLRLAITTAERLAPIVLWIDELEKSLGTTDGSGDSGASRRMLGTFLAWLQEKSAKVFVVATSNDISQLPPELLRKGRFDEIFFLDLPGVDDRRQILALHLEKRFRDPNAFDLEKLAQLSDGFSGAECEQAVVSALFGAFETQTELATEHVVRALERTKPLSETMAEPVLALRAWAQNRTVLAN